jgi:surface polysaccharide O-acyltransferase-like enzyme
MAMLMVVLVHTTAQIFHLFEPHTFQHQAYHFLNRIIRVESSLFIMLVGIVFFYNYRTRELTKDVFTSYWKKRVSYILIPYIVWSAFYEYFNVHLGARTFDFAAAWDRLLNGGSHYQLWFIYLIVQFYLVFPLVLVIVRRSAFLQKYFWLIGFLIEFVFYVLNLKYRFVETPHFFLNYFAAFSLGAWIGLHYEEFSAKIRGWKIVLAGSGSLLCGIIYVSIHYRNLFGDPVSIPTPYYRLVGIIFLTLGALFFFYISERFVGLFGKDVTSKLKYVAMYSFGYYLVHPMILYYVMLFFPTKETGLSWHVMIWLQYILAVIGCYFFIWLFHRFVPLAGFIFGKLPKEAPLFWKAGESKRKARSSEKAEA